MSDEVKKQSLQTRMISVELSEYQAPIFQEPREGTGLILCGEPGKPSFFDDLVDLYRSSNKHNSIINHQVRYICGNGWAVDRLGKTTNEIALFEYYVKKANSKNQNLNHVVKKSTIDRRIYNGFALEIIPNKDGTLNGIYNIDFSLVRAYLTGDQNEPVKYCYLPDWRDVNTLEKAKTKKGFKTWSKFTKDNAKQEATLYYYTEPRSVKSGEVDVYPIPYYIGCIPYIQCDAEIATYCVNGIQNEFWGGKMITFTNGAPATPEEQSRIEGKFKRRHTGTKNARRVVINFVDNQDQKPIVDSLTNEKISEEFDLLNNLVRDEIFTTHGVTHPALFGQKTESGLGGSRDELMDAYELLSSTLITPEKELQASVYNEIFSAFGMNPGLYLNEVKPFGIKFSENVIVQALDPADLKELVYKQLGVKAKTDTVKMSALSEAQMEELYLQHLEASAEKLDNADVLDSFRVDMNADKVYNFSDRKYTNQYFAKALDSNLTEDEASVISILNDDGATTPDKIAEALDLSVDEVISIIERLQALKFIKGDVGKSMQITKNGENFIENNDVPLKIVVRYKYSDAGAPALRKGGQSRPFCQRLMALTNTGHVWTRESLMMMLNPDGESAWIHGGGFYYNPFTKKTSDKCRHHWEAVIKKLKQ